MIPSVQNLEFEFLKEKWLVAFEKLPPPFMPLDRNSFEIQWNARMRSRAGLCIPGHARIELNPHLLKTGRVFEEVLVHELCHLSVSRRWPRAQPHGSRWASLMRQCGFEPRRCHELVPERRYRHRRWEVPCPCRIHTVATVTFRRILGGTRYRCTKCQGFLSHSEAFRKSL
jgi:SprT protein